MTTEMGDQMKTKRYLLFFLILFLLFCFSAIFYFFISKLNYLPETPERDNENKGINLKIANQNNTKNGNETKSEIGLSLVGDILLAENVGKKIDNFGINYPFERVKAVFSESDFTLGNLESSVAACGTAIKGKEYTFRADPKVLQGLKWSGINIVSVANNHVLDFGTDAFLETIKNLESSEINYIGGGENIDEAFKPVIVKKNDKKVAIFGASRVIPYVWWYAGENKPGVAGAYNPERLISEIKNIREQVDYIVVYLHWGTERETSPNKKQITLARQLIDSGADVVAGSHPHVLQGFEFYKGKLIAYSLGNFVFTNYGSPTIILNIKLDNNRVQSASVIPCIINNYVPEPVETKEGKQKIYDLLEQRSINMRIVDGNIFEFNNNTE